MCTTAQFNMRGLYSLILAATVCAGVGYGATYGGGSGTAEDPYQIWTAEQLIEMGLNTTDYDKCFVLMADLDLTGKSSTQAVIAKDTSTSDGFQGVGFSGSFDGNGHVIRNLTITIDRTGIRYGFLGLFGQIDTAGVIKHLSLEQISITGNSQADYFGGIAGNCLGRIENCHTSGSVSYQWYLLDPVSCDNIGGVAGNVEGGQVLDCDSACAVSGDYNVGGLVGRNAGTIGSCRANSIVQGDNSIGGLVGLSYKGTVHDSSSKGSVSGGNDTGGLIGSNTRGFVRQCYSTAFVIGGDYSGGLIGQCYLSQIDDCSATGDVMLADTSVPAGGLIGRSSQSSLFRCSATGSVTGLSSGMLGGLVGELYDDGTLQDCFARGSVAGNNMIGGLVGRATMNQDLSIRNCFASGSASGSGTVGGLVGLFAGTGIVNSYSTGIVQGNSYSGGLIGRLAQGSVTDSFWDTQSSGMTTSAGGVGKTTAEMKTQATFTNASWDFLGETANGTEEIWRMCQEGIDYPSLAFASSNHGDFACPDGMGMDDLMVLAERWMAATPLEIGSADGNGDGVVNLSDLGILSEYWMMLQLPDPDFLLHLKMDGDFSDSASGYSGTGTGDPVFVGADQAKVGSGAVALDGDDGIVITGFKGIPGSAPRTCAAWVKTTSSWCDILQWGESTPYSQLWKFEIADGFLAVYVSIGGVTGKTRVNTGQWVHVAAVLSQGPNGTSDLSLYVNGVLDSFQSSIMGFNTGINNDVVIGNYLYPLNFSVMIDDVRIYSRALTADEIAGLMETSAGVYAGLDQMVNLHADPAAKLKGQFTGDWVGTSVQWEQISGPQAAVIADPTALVTTVEFAAEGQYGFRLTATDGTISASDEVSLVVANGLVGYWPFDRSLAEYMGNSAMAVGDPEIVDAVQAKVGSGAVRLDGNDGVVMNGFNGILGTQARTCMAWIKTTVTAAPIVYWGDNTIAGGMWEMRVASLGQFRVQMIGCGVTGVSVINTGQWVHVAAVLPEGANNADDVLLYVNGALESGAAVTPGTIDTKAGLTMRIGVNNVPQYFLGMIDDVRMYDRALTAEEIAGIAGK